MEQLHQSLEAQRDKLSDLKNGNTFDLDEEINGDPSPKVDVKSKTPSQLKKEDRDVGTFRSTLNYYEKKRQDRKFSLTGKNANEMDIIENPEDIEQLDHGKTWKQLDNWMRKQKLKQYAQSSPIENYEKILLDRYNKGEFKKTSDVTYDSKTGKIISLKV